MALGEDHPEPEDKIIPKYKQIAKVSQPLLTVVFAYAYLHQRTGAYVQEWAEELEAQQEKWQANSKPAATATKRPAPQKSNGDAIPTRKKSKLVDAGDIDEATIRTAWERSTLAKVSLNLDPSDFVH